MADGRRDGHTRRLAVALLTASVLVAGPLTGCSDDGDTPAASTDGRPSSTTRVETDGTTPPGASTTVVTPTAVDYSERGPYEVGRTTVRIEGTEVYVFYPVDEPGDAEHVTEVSSDLAFPEAFRAIAPAFFIQQLPTDHHLDATASDEGPFPLVLHSHGFAGFPLYATAHLEHTASWGYVVAAPSHPSRNLAGALGGGAAGPPAAPDADVVDLERTIDAVTAASEDADGVLLGAVDTERLAAEGHSAGGGAVGALALRDERVDTVIGQAPGAPIDLPGTARDAPVEERVAAVTAALADAEPPSVPVLYVAGERDGVIPLAVVQAVFDWLAPPRELVVVANAGHNPFLDICKPIAAQGGLLANAGELAQNPAFVPLLALGEDGCTDGFLDPELGYALIDHLTVAWLRWVFADDTELDALDPEFLEATFPDATGPVTAVFD